MGAHDGKFLPRPTPETEIFWLGCRNNQLMIQRCTACGHHQFYPRMLCTECASAQVDWVQASGRGTVKSFTIVRRPVTEAYAAETPYVIALIELDEGPTLMSNVTACDVEKVHIGMPVTVSFEAWSDDITMPLFRPAT
ncbi:MAG: Zn-ribbon domain-containing OB-fold protein [Chromatiales bacterium]|nr:MAG: Zn-ribbon domain-containing OB-fold protein [Chromatiales bacterium]